MFQRFPWTGRPRPSVRRLGPLLVLSLALTGCATNPVTGQPELSLISEPEEIQMGREGAEEVARAIGLYADTALQRYVAWLGQALAARSERPHLPWSFQIVDDPAVNAFALPGGFIFVTRGILGHLNSEAELVAVLGHEIGHVTAKHSVRRISRAQVAQLPLGVATAVLPELAPFGRIAGVGLGLVFLKFGRDDENQADELGFRYALENGYDVGAMTDVFRTLGRVGASEGDRLPEWLSTHPNPENRLQRTAAWVRTVTPGRPLTVNREAYLARIDGLVFGKNPRAGYFEGPVFYHPELRFRFGFPPGWKTQNQVQAVVGVSPAKDALIQLSLAGRDPPHRAAQRFVSRPGLESGPLSTRDINGLPAATTSFAARTRGGTLNGLVTFVSLGGATYRILALTPAQRFHTYDAAFRLSVASFRRLTDPAALGVQPARVELVRVPTAMTIAQFDRRYPSSIPLEQVALINGLEAGSTVGAGETAKRVTGGKRP